jgi:hypothetical protein
VDEFIGKIARAESEIVPEVRIRHDINIIAIAIVAEEDTCAVRMPAAVVELILMHWVPHFGGRQHSQAVAAIGA